MEFIVIGGASPMVWENLNWLYQVLNSVWIREKFEVVVQRILTVEARREV